MPMYSEKMGIKTERQSRGGYLLTRESVDGTIPPLAVNGKIKYHT